MTLGVKVRSLGVIAGARNEVVDDGAGRSRFGLLRRRIGLGAFTDHDVQAVEDEVVARGRVDRTLRANHIRLRRVVVHIDLIGALCRRDGEDEAGHNGIVSRSLLLAVVGGPDVAVITRIPGDADLVGFGRVLSALERQLAVKREIELHAGSALVIGNDQIDGQLFARLCLIDIRLAVAAGIRAGTLGVISAVRNEVVNNRTLCLGGSGRLHGCRSVRCFRGESRDDRGDRKAEGRQCGNKSLHHIPFPDNVRGSGNPRAHQPSCLLGGISRRSRPRQRADPW